VDGSVSRRWTSRPTCACEKQSSSLNAIPFASVGPLQTAILRIIGGGPELHCSRLDLPNLTLKGEEVCVRILRSWQGHDEMHRAAKLTSNNTCAKISPCTSFHVLIRTQALIHAAKCKGKTTQEYGMRRF
jgi:hypothetical protein